ncbi:hypothetical protein C0989_002805 [Termitomyces sp. Mn162]|nr:hypothetical protein C0989_002805 [Termitomyces sp. Mn162]
MQDDQAKILNLGLFKLTLLWFECFGVDEDVVDIYTHYALCNEVLEDVIHHGLESGRAVGESEEHNKQLEQSLVGPEGGLPLISFLDMHIVVAPLDIQFNEVLHTPEVLVYATKLPSTLLLWSSTTALVVLIEGLSTKEHQRWGIQEVQISKRERSGMTFADGCMLSNTGLAFLPVLHGTGRALPRASAHGYLSFGLIYLGVVLMELHETKDHVLPTQAGDSENGMLHMIPIAENQVSHRVDGACFVRHSVNVVDWNGLGEGLCGQAMAFDKLQV